MLTRALTAFVILILIGACLKADDDWVIREDGVGAAKIGMSLSQVKAALHERLVIDENRPSGSDGCSYVRPIKHRHISFMILDGHFVRADVDARGMATTEGSQVGDLESATLRTYGAKMKVEPHQYIDDGHYLTMRSSTGKYGVRFETEKGKIISFYVGLFSAIQYVEGCN
jgi:hypothetical protein